MGTLPEGVLDVARYLPVLDRPGPVATVCLPTPGAVEHASQQNRVAWDDLRDQLSDDGAPETVLAAIDEVVPDAHQHGEGLAVAADDSGLLLVDHSPVPPRHTFARWDTLASIGPVISWRQHQPPYVVVLVDHVGADLVASGADIRDEEREAGGVATFPLRAAARNEWDEDHYQQKAIDNWERNAKDVAAELVAMVERTDPAIILAGGDPYALELLLHALPPHVRERVEQIHGSRAADSGGDRTAVEVAHMVATAAARSTVAVLEELRQHLGRHDRAVEGTAAVLDALRQSQVAALLVHDDPGDHRRAWFGDAPGLVAAQQADLAGLGGSEAREGRLVDVALRAAAQTGAAVHLVPLAGGPADGLGALLRWSA